MNRIDNKSAVVTGGGSRIGEATSLLLASVLFLASEDSAFMTGSELVIDGGYTAV